MSKIRKTVSRMGKERSQETEWGRNSKKHSARRVSRMRHGGVQNGEREKSGDRSQETAFDCGTRSFIK